MSKTDRALRKLNELVRNQCCALEHAQNLYTDWINAVERSKDVARFYVRSCPALVDHLQIDEVFAIIDQTTSAVHAALELGYKHILDLGVVLTALADHRVVDDEQIDFHQIVDDLNCTTVSDFAKTLQRTVNGNQAAEPAAAANGLGTLLLILEHCQEVHAEITLVLPRRSIQRENRAHISRIATTALAWAIWLLPIGHRARFDEEFREQLSTVCSDGGGRWAQCRYAISMLTHAPALRRALSYGASQSREHAGRDW